MNKPSANDELFGRYLDGVAGDEDIAVLRERLLADSEAVDSLVAAARFETLIRTHLVDTNRNREIENLLNPVPSDPPLVLSTLSTTHYPLPTAFVGGPVFSYLVATVVLCLMLLGAWAYRISHDHESIFVNNSRGATTSGPEELVFVGKITGMKNCRWSIEDTQTVIGAGVALDRKYALSSGLLEITYKSGARVILEGPCTYKVDSNAGGFLAAGKLTARVEKKGSGFGVQDSKHSPLSTLHSPLFAVRTPTAIVTDLGTEFGVAVDENGDTISYVFEGSIQVQGLAASSANGAILKENESIRVSRVRETHQDSETTSQTTVSFTHPTKTPKFVRRLYEPPKQLDLLDIIVGGDGTGKRRERGIDPQTGMEDPIFIARPRGGDRLYHPVGWNRLIDGAFVPDGTAGVQLDSANHTFDGFPPTCGEAWGSIWARAPKVKIDWERIGDEQWIYGLQNGGQFMPNRRGLLGIHSNAGITFDLRAIAQANNGAVPARFTAVAGMADVRPMLPSDKAVADVWVFVDGQIILKREKLRLQDGVFNVDIELESGNRFLTLVVTDGGDQNWRWDCIVFGDPVLEMKSMDLK